VKNSIKPAVHPALRALSLLLGLSALLGIAVLPMTSKALASHWVLVAAIPSLLSSALLAVGLWRMRRWSFAACVAWIIANLVYIPTFDYYQGGGPTWFSGAFLVVFVLFAGLLAKHLWSLGHARP
jgi:hypothetical protein